MSDVIINGVDLSETSPSEAKQIAQQAVEAAFGIAPGGGAATVPNPQAYVAQLIAGKNFYFNPDEAIRQSRPNAIIMRRDLAIMEPLQARQMAVAQLPWHIEPENKRDKRQVKVAAAIQKIIEDIPDFLKLKLALLEAIFYGRYGVNMDYCWDYTTGNKRMIAKGWNPINGDSLDFKQWSDQIAVKTGIPSSTHGKHLTVEPSEIGLSHVLTPWEREAFVIHSHLFQAGDYTAPYQAAYVKGVGIRTFVYWTWWLKHETLGILMNYIDRFGTGVTIFYFESGNPASESAVKDLAQSYAHNNIILWPRMPGTEHGASGIERIQPDANGINNLLKIVDDYYNKQISRYIRGQDSTAESNKGNASVADLHAETFAKLINLDAINLSETLSQDMVRILMKYNYPDAKFKCKFKINVERPDPQRWLESAKTFYELGGVLDENEVRSIMGFSKPTNEDDVLSKKKSMLEGVDGPAGDQNIRISHTGEKEMPTLASSDAENQVDNGSEGAI